MENYCFHLWLLELANFPVLFLYNSLKCAVWFVFLLIIYICSVQNQCTEPGLVRYHALIFKEKTPFVVHLPKLLSLQALTLVNTRRSEGALCDFKRFEFYLKSLNTYMDEAKLAK